MNVVSTKRWQCCGAQWRRAALAAGIALAATSFPLSAQSPPPSFTIAPGYSGVWFDDTGQGAVEITPCNGSLCGRIVWLREPRDKSGRPLTDQNNSDARQRSRPICGLPVIGSLKRQPDGTWDAGWIYDPKQGKQFDAALRLQNPTALQVTGYLGFKWLSESFIWKRAPVDLPRCTV